MKSLYCDGAQCSQRGQRHINERQLRREHPIGVTSVTSCKVNSKTFASVAFCNAAKLGCADVGIIVEQECENERPGPVGLVSGIEQGLRNMLANNC